VEERRVGRCLGEGEEGAQSRLLRGERGEELMPYIEGYVGRGLGGERRIGHIAYTRGREREGQRCGKGDI